MKPYPKYKPSNIQWLCDIPEHWNEIPIALISSENKLKNNGNYENNVLSLSYGKIKKRNVENNFGLLPDSFETYQIVHNGDLVLRLTDLQNDKKSLRVGLVKEQGIITSAYLCLKLTSMISNYYFYYLLHTYDIRMVYYSMGGGVRQSIGFEEIRKIKTLLPPLPEQTAIATFLDKKTKLIDSLVEKKQKYIELLKEKRTALINEAVTGQLIVINDENGLRAIHRNDKKAIAKEKAINPKFQIPKYKDSGIEWLGAIPEEWEVKKLKHCSIINFSNVDKHIFPDEMQVRLCNYTDVYKNEKIDSSLTLSPGSCNESEVYSKNRTQS